MEIKNVNDVRDALAQTLKDLMAGNMRVADAKERSNAAGKMINSAKVQLEYQLAQKKEPSIDFLEGS
jgi:hypothetical protein